MFRHPFLLRIVALLLLAWICGDIVGTGMCPDEIDPCTEAAGNGVARSGLPHGQHSGMVTLHVGHCLCHGLVTLSRCAPVAGSPELLCITVLPIVPPTMPGVAPPIDHPPQLFI